MRRSPSQKSTTSAWWYVILRRLNDVPWVANVRFSAADSRLQHHNVVGIGESLIFAFYLKEKRNKYVFCLSPITFRTFDDFAWRVLMFSLAVFTVGVQAVRSGSALFLFAVSRW